MVKTTEELKHGIRAFFWKGSPLTSKVVWKISLSGSSSALKLSSVQMYDSMDIEGLQRHQQLVLLHET